MKTLADYLNWRAPKESPKGDSQGTWRPPVVARDYMYDQPQNKLFSPLDKDPIIRRVLVDPKVPAPRAFPIWGNPRYHFFAGMWTGAVITLIFTCKSIGRQEVENLVKYDPAYFPEFAKQPKGATA
mmetsp:Transcript_1719/g.4331  ORF Transcript_1719/g.4331 Transcript_1719/m.4331 type:complete len:126 (+) Transcript_1719:62-439(+)|eukprot:CAMPEP_0202352596 /NCGR_PEP_ID=MMETSP1126-20121109/8721_1 /ASSEMBLY_ACC=CAM_ASM_000457 /TAXON_ID=3047 /ORGANISM="Dunaliella tertiolecta, Strain CCMP1320" /LENGTH=125 /DNA_ID=CAMNT_0048944831 /DNA_START=53 /DNA_END=430 /DNA_ORIENTATION=-